MNPGAGNRIAIVCLWLLAAGITVVYWYQATPGSDAGPADRQHSPGSEVKRAPAEQTVKMENAEPVPDSIPIRYGPATIRKVFSEAADPHRPDSRCDHTPNDPIRELPAGGIFKWTDENGIIHYQDFEPGKRPAFDGLEVVSEFPPIKDYFNLDIQLASGSLPPGLKEDIQVRATRLYEIYRGLMDDRWLQRSHINLVVYGDAPGYRSYRSRFIPDAGDNIPGFYTAGLNQAVVLYQGQEALTARVVMHEITHVINNRIFGRLPRWLNEGLATYFETMKLSGGKVRLAPEQDWPGYLAALERRIGLRELIAATPGEWNIRNRSVYYGYSRALVYFLMAPENRDFSARLLDRLAESGCNGMDTTAYFETEYSGGLAGLEADWNHWLQSGVDMTHDY